MKPQNEITGTDPDVAWIFAGRSRPLRPMRASADSSLPPVAVLIGGESGRRFDLRMMQNDGACGWRAAAIPVTGIHIAKSA
jgi:hypothetical protein